MNVYLQMGIYYMLAILIAAVLTGFFLLAALICDRCFSDELKIPKDWKTRDAELAEKIKHQWDL